MFLSILLAQGSGEALAPKVLTDPFYTLGALGAGLALLRWFAVDLRSIYFFAQSLLVLGFMTFAALGGGRPLIPLALLQLGFGTFGAYLFTLLLYLGSRAGRSEALFGGELDTGCKQRLCCSGHAADPDDRLRGRFARSAVCSCCQSSGRRAAFFLGALSPG